MKVLWIVNMVLPDAAKELGVRTSFSGSWLVDPLKCLSENDNVQLATMTYGFVEEKKVVTVNGVRHYVFPGAGKRLLFTSSQTPKDCREVIDDFQPDLIHIYGTEYSVGYSMLTIQPEVPVLLTIQGILSYISKAYTGQLPWYSFFQMATFKQLLRLKHPVFTQLLYHINARRERKILSMVHYVSGRTKHDRDFIESVQPNIQYFPINYNLREEFYDAEKWSRSKCEEHTIFTGAAGYPLKGLHILIDALALVKKEYPDVKLLIPGNSTSYKESNGYERYIRKKIRKLGLEDQVEFVGRKTTQGMIECLQKANLYVFPSAYDTDSLSLCEAQFLGVPTVTSKRGGSEFLVDDKKTGLCYEFADVRLLSDCICNLFADEALCNRLSECAIEKAEERHNRQKNVQDQLQLYEQIIQKMR